MFADAPTPVRKDAAILASLTACWSCASVVTYRSIGSLFPDFLCLGSHGSEGPSSAIVCHPTAVALPDADLVCRWLTAGVLQEPKGVGAPGPISGHFLQEVDSLLEHGMEPKLVWQKLHLKYRVPVSAPKPEALAKFLALPGHEALRNRAKTLRMRQRKTHGEGEGAKDLVGDPEDALGTGEMTVGGRLVCIGP